MVAPRALAADKRWGFAAAAVAPTRTPTAGVLGTFPEPTNLPTQRGAFTWGDKLMPSASNAWGSSSLQSLKNGGGSGSFSNINDRPSSRGSSSPSTAGSDFLDSPLAWGQTSHNSMTTISHPQSTASRSGSWQFSHFQTSSSDALKAPLKTIAKRGPTSHRKGFTLSADNFLVLYSTNSQSNSQQGHSFQGQPTFSSVIVAAQDEQRKNPITGDDPVPTVNLPREAHQAQLHATQAPDICMPPPCIDYWHPPPDHPPDRNGIWHGGAATYGPCKPADTPGSFPVESLTHNGEPLLNPGGEARHGPVRGGYHPENKDSCYAHVPADACVKSLPHLILGKYKDNHSDTLEKQPAIKKDAVLLQKIKCLNIKARNLRARNMSEVSWCRESKVEHPKSIDVKADHVAKDIPFSTITNDAASAFDMAGSSSESCNHVLNGPSNVSTNRVTTDLSEGHVTESSEARKPGKSVDYHVYGVGNASRNRCGSSAKDTASNIYGHGWEEHSTVDSLPVAMANSHEDQLFPGKSSQQVHVRTADDMLNSPDYEIQHSRRRELSSQHARQPQKEERGEIEQKAKANAKLEALNRHSFVQSQKSNDVLIEADKIHHKQNAGGSGITNHDTSTSDTCTVYAENLNMPLTTNGIKNAAVPISSTPASDTAGVNKGPLTHNGMPSAKKTGINMLEHIAHQSAAQSPANSAPKHLQMEDRQRQVHSQENILRASAPASPRVFCNENTDASSVHKTHISGVVINSSIIPVQAASVRGFTVGSIMIGDVSLASVNQEAKTVAKEVHDTTHSHASPQQTKQSGRNQHGVRHVKDPHGNDSIVCTPIKEPSKKEQSEAGRLNCTAVPAPTWMSGDHSIVTEIVLSTNRSEMERHAHKPAYKEPHLQNLTQTLPAENHTTSYDNLSTSKLETKSCDKEALYTSTAGKAEVETETESLEDKTSSRHLGRSSTSWNQVRMNGSALVVPDLTEQDANSLVLKVMQELSDQLEQIEKQLESRTHDATEDIRLQPTLEWFPCLARLGANIMRLTAKGNTMLMAKETCGLIMPQTATLTGVA